MANTVRIIPDGKFRRVFVDDAGCVWAGVNAKRFAKRKARRRARHERGALIDEAVRAYYEDCALECGYYGLDYEYCDDYEYYDDPDGYDDYDDYYECCDDYGYDDYGYDDYGYDDYGYDDYYWMGEE